MELSYQEVYTMNTSEARRLLIQTYLRTGSIALPLLLTLKDEQELVKRAAQWVYYYNVERPHSGVGMDGQSPWRKLRQLGVQVPAEFAVLPPIVLDSISTDWVLGPGNHLLPHYTQSRH